MEIYLDGFGRFLSDRGIKNIKMSGWSGENDFFESQKIICRQIDNGYLIPYLNLKHQELILKDYVWHWFILNGYEEKDGEFYVKAVSYGVEKWFKLKILWETGYQQKGGLIIFEI